MNMAENDPKSDEFNNSLNCTYVLVDEPGDTTVRPTSGKRREQLLAERERLAPWIEQYMKEQIAKYAAASSDPNDVQFETL